MPTKLQPRFAENLCFGFVLWTFASVDRVNFLFNRIAHCINDFRDGVDFVETIFASLLCAHLKIEGDAAEAIAEVQLNVAPVP